MDNRTQEILKVLKSRKQAVEEDLRQDRYDFSDESALKRLQEEIDTVFTERVRSYRASDSSKQALKDNDLTPLIQKKRKQAVEKLAISADKTYGETFPGLCVAHEYIRISAPCHMLTFDSLNKEYDIELAAALWMLDELSGSDRYEEAAAFFPQTDEDLDSVYLPNLSDATHSDDAIRAMLCLIRRRNRGLNGYDENKAFIDEAQTGLKGNPEHYTFEDRKRFDAVMALIDDEKKEQLKEEFLSYLSQFTETILKLIEKHKAPLRELKESVLKELELQIGLLEAKQPAIAAPPTTEGGVVFTEATVSGSQPAAIIPPEAAASDERVRKLVETIEAAENEIDRIYRFMLLYPLAGTGRIKGFDEEKVLIGFEGLRITRPYEMCFAFLLLLDENSDHIWSYNLCYDVLSYACQALPWAGCNVIDPDNDREEIQIDYRFLASLAEKAPDWNESRSGDFLYQKKVRSPLVNPESSYISIAQLAFLSSGLIPPRQNDLLLFTKILLSDAPLTKSEADIWHAYFTLAYAAAHKEPGLALEDDSPAEEPIEDEQAKKDAEEEQKALKHEVKRLRKLVNQLEHRNKECTDELVRKDRKLQTAVTELAELRTMIRESVHSDEESPVAISFPYTSKKRAVIIVGHESWVKAIKPLLQNVRFISPSEQPHPGVILNADIVWIQTNALGHSGYYKVIDIVRKNNIKVCYFRYASAEKCAEQFALEDEEETAETTESPEEKLTEE